MNDNSHEPDYDRRSFLLTALFGGTSLLLLLLSALMKWIMKKTEELRRKQKQERYKNSPIYPYPDPPSKKIKNLVALEGSSG
jgi:hypothetical protein